VTIAAAVAWSQQPDADPGTTPNTELLASVGSPLSSGGGDRIAANQAASLLSAGTLMVRVHTGAEAERKIM
jgi:hypothetical protein